MAHENMLCYSEMMLFLKKFLFERAFIYIVQVCKAFSKKHACTIYFVT